MTSHFDVLKYEPFLTEMGRILRQLFEKQKSSLKIDGFIPFFAFPLIWWETKISVWHWCSLVHNGRQSYFACLSFFSKRIVKLCNLAGYHLSFMFSIMGISNLNVLVYWSCFIQHCIPVIHPLLLFLHHELLVSSSASSALHNLTTPISVKNKSIWFRSCNCVSTGTDNFVDCLL